MLSPIAAIRGSNYHGGGEDAHHEAGLVEVVHVFLEDAVVGFDVVYKRKPLANNLWIFAFGPLVVVFTCKTRPEFWLAFDEVVSPADADRGRVTLAE